MGYLSRAGLARESGKSLYEIDRLLASGLPHTVAGSGRGTEVRIDRAKATRWLIDHVLATVSGERADDAPEIVQQRARLFRLQADAQEMKNATTRAHLLPAEEVVAGWQAAIGRSRALLLGIPPAAAAQLVLLAREHEGDAAAAERAIRESLTRAVDAALTELANTNLDDDDEDDAGDGDAVVPA